VENINPSLIALARESRGWTQRDLATAIRAAQGTVAKYELGAIPVPDYHVDALCRSLNYDRALFEQPGLLVGLGGDFLYRKRAKLAMKKQRRVEAEANIRKLQVMRLLRGAAVEERYPLPTLPLDEFPGHPGKAPAKAAQETRRAFRLPRGPVRNLTRVLENAGAIIFTVDFGTDLIDGTNIRLPGLPPLLFLNAKVAGERHRFNLAHELGHAVMHFSTASTGDPEEEANALPSFSDVVAAVASGRVEAGVLPIESSISGPVAETHDLLVDSATSINAQVILPIRHFLVGVADVPLAEIRIIRSHPVALDQCRRLVASLPEAEAIAAGTTADAAAQVARDGEPTEAAIASELAAALHGLVVLAADVGDHPEAFTRFVSISNRTQLAEGSDWRIAFSFQTDHRPGALHRAIEPFARHALDLVQLTSRPIPQTPWRYRFDAVLSGHPLDPVVCETLAEVRRQAQRFTVFGSYPA